MPSISARIVPTRSSAARAAAGAPPQDYNLNITPHPVCGATVASRNFLVAAATPPGQEGRWPRPPLLQGKDARCWNHFLREGDDVRMTREQQHLMSLGQFLDRLKRVSCPLWIKIDKDIVEYHGKRVHMSGNERTRCETAT